MHRRWLVNRSNPEYIRYLSRTASVSPVLAQIFINRGIKTSEEISSFLNANVSQLSDPFNITGMKEAVDRIITAVRNSERILVHGDYDADGLSATAIMLMSLRILGADCHPFIPNRMEHGYGFTPPSVREAKKRGVSLIVTVDCGITSFEAAGLCRKEGIDVIVTDHHEPLRNLPSSSIGKESMEGDFLLPDALITINPKISSPGSPASNLSGAGIALKVAHALDTARGSRLSVNDLFDLAAIGTMADVVPLTGENRVIVREGLQLIDTGVRPGLRALKKVSGIDGKDIKTGLLLFTLIPRINAAGRLSDSGRVLDLLLADSENEAKDIALWLDDINSERQQIEEKVYQEAVSLLGRREMDPVIVLSSEGWHRGVIGIVASRIAQEFYRPTVILSEDGPISRGSARSIPPFDLHKALSDCKKFLKNFGGHKQAAGLELESRNIFSFAEYINRLAREMLAEEDFIPSLEIDTNVELTDITFDLTKEIEMLEPFGFGNPAPLLGCKGLEVLHARIVKHHHLKMKLRQKNRSIDAIGFSMAPHFEKLGDANMVDAVFIPTVNEWEGLKCLQLNLKGLRPSKES
jgi:single-stranded-DNA-specific exonuclease